MGKYLLLPLLMVLLIGLMVPGCGYVLSGSGNVETRSYNLSDFEEIKISSTYKYEISHSDIFSVTVTTDDNIFDYIDISQDNKLLAIGLKPISIHGSITLEVAVQLPTLKYLEASGATSGTVSGFTTEEETKIILSGASRLTLDQITSGSGQLDVSGASRVGGSLETENLKVDISGASRVELEGKCSVLDARVSGASTLDASAFTCGDVSANIDGASNAVVNSSGTLDAIVAGASRLEYMGEPSLREVNVSGASTLVKR